MLITSVVHAYSTFSPDSARTDSSREQVRPPAGNEPPRKPDWLLVMVSILFLLTLLIAWLVGVPVLGR
ncbi:hypothetical protein [Spirosoma areae]